MIRVLAVAAGAGAAFAAGLIFGVYVEDRVHEEARLEWERELQASRATAKYHAESSEMWRAEATSNAATPLKGGPDA